MTSAPHRLSNQASSTLQKSFIARLNIGENALLENVTMENVTTLSKLEEAENSEYVCAQSNLRCGPEFCSLAETSEACKVQNGTYDTLREAKKFTKGPFSSGSTLMKPTLSQLAKQNRLRQVKRSQSVHRFAKPSLQKREEIIEDSHDTGTHASKRQKLEGGNLWKVAGVKEETNFLHKAPQKESVHVDFNFHRSRMRITIPREPELETAQRARRQRAQRLRSDGAKESQQGKAPAIPTFTARPLNRKILEAPSLPLPQKSMPRLPHFQPFHLKTDERALQHTTIPASSLVVKNPFSPCTEQAGAPNLRKLHCESSSASIQPKIEQKMEGCDSSLMKFKAQPLNKKILSSKGDIGVFRSTKRETTKPMEFNLSSSKRSQQDPPIELFNKLSLNTNMHQTASHKMLPPHGVNKDWKENMNCTVQHGHKGIYVKEESRRHGKTNVETEVAALPDQRSKTNKLCMGIR